MRVVGVEKKTNDVILGYFIFPGRKCDVMKLALLLWALTGAFAYMPSEQVG